MPIWRMRKNFSGTETERRGHEEKGTDKAGNKGQFGAEFLPISLIFRLFPVFALFFGNVHL